MTLTTQRLILICMLWLAGLGAAAQFAKIAVPFFVLRSTYPEAGDQIGWLLSIISLLGVIFGIVVGGIVARIGEKRILVGGLALGAAISLSQATVPSFTLMLASRLIEGISHLAIVVAAPTLIAQLSGDRLRPFAMSFWSTFFGVAFALYAWVILPILPSGELAPILTSHGVYMGAVAILIAVLIPSSTTHSEARPINMLATHLRAYRSPFIAAPAMGWLFYTLTFVSLIALIPERLPEGQAVWATGLMPVMSIATSMIFVPLIAARLSSVNAIYAGFAIGAALIPFAILIDIRALVAVLFFGVIGLVQGGSFAAVPELNKRPEDQALAYGFMAQTGNIGNLLGTPILLWVISLGGDIAKYGTITALYLTAIAAHLALAMARRA
ncbi:MAG: MFS transporter [Pseudomonadota bacterium]